MYDSYFYFVFLLYYVLISTYVVSLFLVFTIIAGCVRIQPWERDILAKRVMTFDSEQEENILDHTFYNAREGAAGGFESGGGGCGCN